MRGGSIQAEEEKDRSPRTYLRGGAGWAARSLKHDVGLNGASPVIAGDDGALGEGDDVQGDVEDIIGGSAADVFFANSADNRLLGGLSDDWLYGGWGDDQLDGGPGADRLRGSSLEDTLWVARGTTI